MKTSSIFLGMCLLVFCFLMSPSKAYHFGEFKPFPVVADQILAVDFWVDNHCGSAAQIRSNASVSVEDNVITLKVVGYCPSLF